MRSFPVRKHPEEPFLLSDAANLLGVEPEGATDPSLHRIAPLDQAGRGDLSPVGHRRYRDQVERSGASALLVSREMVELLPEGEDRPRIVVPDVHRAMSRLLDWLFPVTPLEPEIHPTAVLGPGVRLGAGLRIGPYAVVEERARIGDGARIGAHCVVGAEARIGSEAFLHPHVVVYPGTVVGRRVTIHAGGRVGVDGFGYVFEEGAHRPVPQVGGCELEDDVDLGANSTVDRGSIGNTRVERGTKIDNLVHLGHNVTVGPHSVVVAQVGVAGSTRLGSGVVAGGQVGIGGHLRIGDGAQLAARAGIMGDVPPGATYMGFPGRPRMEFLRSAAAQGKVPELLKRVRALEAEVERLREEGEGAT
jgi:UDP-3-O-[3-hydroxymyristoyl] glucosamine N-acyltransferase